MRQFRDGLRVLRSPAKIALLFFGNLTTQVLYSLALGTCVLATGDSVGLVDLLLIINLVGTFAAIIPVPNGMGVQEAGLTAGLVAAGVPEEPAFAAVLVYRVLSAYLPPVWGFVAMRSLQKQNYPLSLRRSVSPPTRSYTTGTAMLSAGERGRTRADAPRWPRCPSPRPGRGRSQRRTTGGDPGPCAVVEAGPRSATPRCSRSAASRSMTARALTSMLGDADRSMTSMR